MADFNGDGQLDIAFACQDDGKSYAVTSYVYWGSASGFATGNRTKLPTVGGAGVLMAADPGGLYSRGATQVFVSRVLDSGKSAPVYHQLSLKLTTPAKTAVKLQLRSAPTAAGISSATWYGATAAGGYYSAGAKLHAAHQGHRYLQYRAELSSGFGNTPVLDSVTITFH